VHYNDGRGVSRLRDVALTIHRGEILGVIGVEGSGQRELLRLLAGRLAPTAGRVERPERVGFIPEDRLHDAIIPAMSVTENLVLGEAAALTGLVDWRAQAIAAAEVVAEHEVRAPGVATPLAALSGGNQQKFVVGRERRLAPAALVAENPTRGLDVRAADRVRQAIRDVATTRNGAAVVFSTDLEEVLALTQRVVACFEGRVTEIVAPEDPADRAPYANALLGVRG
jgi:simple sugar transport system ATP-binding protein